MTETKTTYTAGPVTFVSDPTPEELLAEYFTFTDTGLTIFGLPTQQHFDLCALQLAANLDKMRWQIGDLAVSYRQRFGGNAYERMVAMSGFSVKPDTIEQWAYTCRNVPHKNRCTELSLWFHRIVAKLPIDEQQNALGECLTRGMRYAEFNKYVSDRSPAAVETSLPPRGNTRDTTFELTQELYDLELKYQERGHELKQTVEETSELKQSITATDARLQALALKLLRILAVT